VNQPRIAAEPAKGLSAEESAVEQRAIDNLQNSLPALVEAYRKKYGTEISTDNAREIVSPDYAESAETATKWGRATQRPAGALADYLYAGSLGYPDPSKARLVVMTAGGTGAGKTTSLRQLPRLASEAPEYGWRRKRRCRAAIRPAWWDAPPRWRSGGRG
jgi:hypothetical protein